MIIVEGLDNTGKTSLVRDLLERFPILTHRDSIGNRHNLDDIHEGARYEAYASNPLVLSDRSRIVSEWVYNPVLRTRPMAFTFTDWVKFLGSFAQGHHLVIYMTRDWVDLIHSFEERDQLTGVKENLAVLTHRYDLAMGGLELMFKVQDPVRSRLLRISLDQAPLAYRAVEEYLKGN